MICDRVLALGISSLVFAGCVQSEFGVQVALQVENLEAGPRSAGLSVHDARLAFSRISLTPCASPHGSLGVRLSALLFGAEAHAHSETSPTMLGAPLVHDLLAPEAVTMGTLAPPPGEYCDVLVFGAPPDADAPGLSAAPAMRGHALRIVGTRDSDGASWTVTRDGWWSVTQRLDPPLVVRPEAPRAGLVIGLDLRAALAVSAPVTEANPDAVASALLRTMQVVWRGSRDDL